MNTDSQLVCHLAILGQADYLPWRAARQCYCHQREFNYMEERDLLDNATVDGEGIHLAGMNYQALIIEHDPPPDITRALFPLIRAGRVYRYSADEPADNLLGWLDKFVTIDVCVHPQTTALRVRHVIKDHLHYYLMFNEEHAALDFILENAIEGPWQLFDPVSGCAEPLPAEGSIHLEGHELKILISYP